MNDLGRIASGIVTYDFPNDTGTYNIGFVSGWLETNIGELNGLIHEPTRNKANMIRGRIILALFLVG